MKRSIKVFIALLGLVLILSNSCTATKKDCRGKTKHKLSNGIYM